MTSKRNEDNWKELNSLVALFEDTLQGTTKARNVLAISNQQARGLLTDWEIPEFPYKEPICTCNNTSPSSEEELNEIVRDIEKAVENAQKIREKSNPPERLKVKQKDISPYFAKSNSCGIANTGTKKDIQRIPLAKGTSGNTGQNTGSIPRRINIPKSNSTSKLVTPKTGESITRRLSIKSSKFQTTYQKDFKVPSKSPHFKHLSTSPRKCSKKETSAQDLYTLKDSGLILKEVSSLNQCLIDQRHVALSESKEVNSISATDQTSKQLISNCPVHDSEKIPEKQSTFVDLAEAVDILGVPPELVNYLRSYHSFATKFQMEDKLVRVSKGKKATDRFLEQLADVNDSQWKEVEQEPLCALFSECLPLFTKVIGMKDIDCDIQNRIEDLDKKCQKWFNLNESVDPNVYCVEQVVMNSPLLDISLLNGIWNFKCRMQHKALQYIRYNNAAQWRKFYKNVQDIQRTDLQLQVFDELQTIILLFERCSPGDPSFILLLKAICALCDITKLSLPVIIKS